jgi:hypothetical protein
LDNIRSAIEEYLGAIAEVTAGAEVREVQGIPLVEGTLRY